MMSTPRDLMKSTFAKWKDLAMLNGDLEDYVLFTIAKLCSFALGLGAGYCMWGV
jgi:uridine phosphorylase